MGSGRAVTGSAEVKRKNRIARLKEINEERARLGTAPLKVRGGLSLDRYLRERKKVTGKNAAKTLVESSLAQVQKRGSSFVYGFNSGGKFRQFAVVEPSGKGFVVKYKRSGSDAVVERQFNNARDATSFAKTITQSAIDSARRG